MEDEHFKIDVDEFRRSFLGQKYYKEKQIIKIIILVLLFLIIVIGLIIIILASVSKSKKSQSGEEEDDDEEEGEEEEEHEEDDTEKYYGEINCIYTINDINNNISIISPYYIKKQKISIIIDNNKSIPFYNSYKFDTKGNHNILFIINEENIDRNYMFKDIPSLTKVEMFSENASISTIDSAFENCENLMHLKIKGFFKSNL